MTQGVVIVHPEWGIYLGSFIGLGFFSNIDCVDQTQAATFLSEADARSYIATWDENGDPDKFTYSPVQTAHAQYATIEELDAAGLSQWTAPMKAARMGQAVGGVQ